MGSWLRGSGERKLGCIRQKHRHDMNGRQTSASRGRPNGTTFERVPDNNTASARVALYCMQGIYKSRVALYAQHGHVNYDATDVYENDRRENMVPSYRRRYYMYTYSAWEKVIAH